jgi:glycosyltransferase involved in cell wall biosynthesis
MSEAAPTVPGDRPTVAHYGPAIGSEGGMSSVLDVYSRMPLQRYRFEIVPTWSPDSALWGLVPFSRALAGIVPTRERPAIAHVHLSERGSFVREGAIAAASHALGIRVVLSLHGRDFAEFCDAHPGLVRRVFRCADAIVALGPTTAAVAERHVAPGARVEVVPNPIEAPERVTAAGEQPETVVFGGVVGRAKGVDVLVRAWEQVAASRPDSRLVVAGPPGDCAPVVMPRLAWLGSVPRGEMRRLLASARVAVLPSRAEVMPMFLLEAMAEGRPVVTTPIADIPATVGKSGRMVPVEDAGALAVALVELLSDPATATREGDALRRRALADFSPRAIGEQLESVYDRVLRSTP